MNLANLNLRRRAERHVAKSSFPVGIRLRWMIFGLLMTGISGQPAILVAGTPDLQNINRESHDLAAKLIPFNDLTQVTQDRLWNVCNKPTLYRRLPAQTLNCSHDLYLFFTRNPEVIVNMWQLMGVTSVNLKRIGPFTFDATDGAGTNSKVEIIYGNRTTQVMFGEGTYEGPLLKRKVNGRCVMVLTTNYGREEGQRTDISSQLDVFLQLDNSGADLLAKTLQPLLGKTADHNFAETAGFVARVSQAIDRNPGGVERLASRLNNVSPEVRDQFVRVSLASAKAAAQRSASTLDATGAVATSTGILPPTRVPADRNDSIAPVQPAPSSRTTPTTQRR